jgi:hypothetical protein
MEKLLLTFVMGIVLVVGVTVIAFNVRDKQHCEKRGGVYSDSTCFKREVIQE